MLGDEAYAGASSYIRLMETTRNIFGYEYIQPVHQGRAAEKVLFLLLLRKGLFAISNMFFDTTRAHVELAGARCIDCVVGSAKNPEMVAKFKGNMDLKLMEKTILAHGAENIGLVVMTITNNSAGGQPVSMQNIRDVAAMCKKYNLILDLDAARYAENAYFIQRDEPDYAQTSIRDIVREMFSYADMFTMSAKKDGIVNMGGLIGVRDPKHFEDLVMRIKANCISYEGFITYGGLNGRDMEALGDQIEREAGIADTRIRKLVDDAIARGLAQPVRRR